MWLNGGRFDNTCVTRVDQLSVSLWILASGRPPDLIGLIDLFSR